MIDIHSHILPYVDDGCGDPEKAVNMLEDAIAQGVTDIILTPHYRAKYCMEKEDLQKEFAKFSEYVKSKNLPINIYLGQEIFVTSNVKQLITEGKVATLNGSKFVLVEFDTENEIDIAEEVYELAICGYVPIVAHLERYYYADAKTAFEIKQSGGMVQVNAESVVGRGKIARKTRQMLKYALVDFIASDMHYGRSNHLAESRQYVKKKLGDDAEKILFEGNAERILKG